MAESKFIDRYDELAVATALLEQLANKLPVQFPLREFTGIGGIGKSSLLRKICAEATNKGIPNLLIDFQEYKGIDSRSTLRSVLEKICNEILLPHLPEETPKILLLKQDLSKDGADNELASVINEIILLTKKTHCVVALDALHLVDKNSLNVLGSDFLFPCSETGNILILVGARSRIDWGDSKYKIWRRTKSTALLTFSIEDTSEQVSTYSDLFEGVEKQKIYQITCGHPEANDVVAQVLQQVEQRSLGNEKISDYESRLINAIVDDVIRERAIIPPEYFELICNLSVFRFVNLDFPPEILHKYNPDKSWNNPVDLISLIQDVQQKTDNVLLPSSNKWGYEINNFVRRCLALYLRLSRPSRYLEISIHALNYYQGKYYNDPTNVAFLVEKIYHLIDVMRLQNPQSSDLDIARRVEKEFKEDLEIILASSYYLATISSQKINPTAVLEPAKRQFLYNQIKDMLSSDYELSDRIGDALVNAENFDGFLLHVLDATWQEYQNTSNVGVFEILKHYKPAGRENEPDYYELSFRSNVNDVVSITKQITISPQTRMGILRDLQGSRTKKDFIRLGSGLYSLLPLQMQEMIKENSGSLILDVNETSTPWELLFDGKDFISLKSALGKKLRSSEVPRINKVPLKDKIRALLIGVPSPSDTSYLPLKHVEEEIDELQKAFRKVAKIDFDPAVDVLFGEEAYLWEVQKRLSSDNYDIIHFAGHAIFTPDTREEGIVLHDGPLYAENIKTTIGSSPLVFLNACHTGRSNDNYVDAGYKGVFLSGTASSFVIGGATACIASLWEVGDAKAWRFGLDYYSELMSGVSVGEALRRSRLKEFQKENDDRLWASYVLFGDPTKRIL